MVDRRQQTAQHTAVARREQRVHGALAFLVAEREVENGENYRVDHRADKRGKPALTRRDFSRGVQRNYHRAKGNRNRFKGQSLFFQGFQKLDTADNRNRREQRVEAQCAPAVRYKPFHSHKPD